MAIAQGSQLSRWYVEETVAGTTPANPAWKPLMAKPSGGMNDKRDVIESETLDGSGFARCSTKGNLQVSGEYEAEDIFTAHDDLLSFAFGAEWETDQPSAGKNRLKAGMLRQTFSVEERNPDIGLYLRSLGCEIGSVKFSVQPNQAPMLNFTVIARDSSGVVNTGVSGATYGTATANCPFDSFTGYIKEGGVTVATVTGMEMTLDRGLEANYSIFSDKTDSPSAKLLSVKGTLTAYFTDTNLPDKVNDSTSSTLEVQLVDKAGNSQTWTIPLVNYLNMTINRQGLGSVTASYEFEGNKDGTSGTNVYIVTDAN